MLEKKPILKKGIFKKKLSKAEQLRGTQNVIAKRFDHCVARHKELDLQGKLGEEIRKFLKKRRERGFAVEEKVLKQHIIQIKRNLLKEHQLMK
ncbi:hypothetical protein [Flammeovirga aprica]|uniref:Uncharacterized protein n=1 Tax=Flammeovirga aprica JL-4 TaxID=694437 RepID=A0A7X9P2X6_9BACT|nr:hypothetical protein [Flammeovirga aprica]NME68203.1 hypothetical protein [Flammeovirga aprica JL-4]